MNNMKTIAIAALFAALVASCKHTAGSDKPADPSAPTGIAVIESGETSLTFQWNVVTGATGYAWKLFQGTTELQSGNRSTRNVKVSGLTAGTTYLFRVASTWDGGISDWSDPFEATTKGSGGGGTDPGEHVSEEVYAEFMMPSVEEEDGLARAFPGAEGGGMFATGGRGGTVLHVTTLEDTGAQGSLRWACTQNYPRIIVFDVAGVIALNSVLQVNRDNCTIAGQTAPGDGICLKNYTFKISASNVIVRFIRCRMGDEKLTEDDAIQILSKENDKYNNIIIDHCSASWSTDECASFYGMKNFTLQWCIISESLRNSIHDKGPHGYGGIWGGTNATYHHNLLAHHDSRNPRIDHDYVSTQKGPLSLVNNVIYNWDGNTCYGGESANTTNTFRKYNIYGNYYKPGPRTGSKIRFIDPMTSCSNCVDAMSCSTIVPGHFYMTGNYMDGKSAMTEDNWTGTTASASLISTIRSDEPFTYTENSPSLTVHSASNAFTAVLGNAGASFARDAVDTRVTNETREGSYTYEGSNNNFDPSKSNKSTKGLIDTQSDVGGWPEYKATAAEIDHNRDSDGDGMPDWFETQFGLDKSDASDASWKNLDRKDRYTNLEMYLHYLVREIVASGNGEGDYKKL